MNIGKEQPGIVIEPAEEPVPMPAEEPVPEPQEPVPGGEPVEQPA